MLLRILGSFNGYRRGEIAELDEAAGQKLMRDLGPLRYEVVADLRAQQELPLTATVTDANEHVASSTVVVPDLDGVELTETITEPEVED